MRENQLNRLEIMRNVIRVRPPLDESVLSSVETMVADALDHVTWPPGAARFEVNDTHWFTAEGKAVVMNKADYVSETFLNRLRDEHGWKKNHKIDGQEIDGYLELPTEHQGYSIDAAALPSLVERLVREKVDIPELFPRIYRLYVERSVFEVHPLVDGLGQLTGAYHGSGSRPVRLGLEFETGNIASSFRALTKLNHLYLQDHIDCGIFVTAVGKAECSTRIWPASNRNGSFEELDKRNYRGSILFPIWEFGFAPDGFRTDVPYFHYTKTGGVAAYLPTPTGATVNIKGRPYLEAKRKTTAPFTIFRPVKTARGTAQSQPLLL